MRIARTKAAEIARGVIERTFNVRVFRNNVRMFVTPGHFYSPIANPAECDRHIAKIDAAGVSDDLPGISLTRTDMIETWHALLPFLKSNPFTATRVAKYRYAFDNPFYSWGDGSVLHAMLRRYRPKRIIEIGCGWSSACMLDTIEHYLDGNCSITFIDPYPATLRYLMGTSTAQILEKSVQDVAVEIFSALAAGDVLFIDSSHVLRTGSDVCFELFEILPRLSAGVLVHFHDMFWPFEYPRAWAVHENRSWNELYAVRAFLTDNTRWRILFFNDYLAKLERSLVETTFPDFLRNSGGSLWIQRQ